MSTSFKQTFSGLSLGVLAFTLIACQPSNRMHTPIAPTKPSPVIEDDLVPTVADDDQPIVKNGVTYETPQKKILNPQAEILLGQMKMEKTKIVYDPSRRQLNVSGLVRILDDAKKEISSAEFNLGGEHGEDESKFLLKSAKNSKSNSAEAPVVGAKVTCLGINAQGDIDCSRAVVDFFVAYKKKVYTQQMEIAQKEKAPEAKTPPANAPTPPPPAPTVTAPAPQTNEVADDPKDDLQSEGQEESIDGRYQGHAETVDLKKVFEDDEAEDTVVAQAPAVAPETKKEDTKPAETPSAPEPKPTPAPVAPKKEAKPISKDLLQTSNGDVRQINQSVGFPDKGNLRNATSLVTKQQTLSDHAFFEVAAPARNRHFATYEMAEMISRLGNVLNQSYSHKLYVGNISAPTGGKLSPHLSHQIGVDADLAYPATQPDVKFPVVVQMSTRQFNPSSFSVAKTYELLKFAFSQSDIKIDRVFIDRTIKKSLCEYAKSQNEFSGKDKDVVNTLFNSIDHVDGHGDHFHLRLKCSTYDPGCRQKLYAVNKGCN